MKFSIIVVFLYNLLKTGVCQNGDCVEDTSQLFRNLSLKKPASQSSVYDGYWDNGVQGFAWKANDGDKNPKYLSGSCSHVAVILDNHWWQVDLQNYYSVTSVTILNRYMSGSRLHDFGIEVSLSDQDDGHGRLREAKPCHYHAGAGIGNSEERTFTCTAGAVGQHVRIYKSSDTDTQDVLTLCEVEVSGYKLNCDVQSTPSSTTTEVTTQSSPTTTEVTTQSLPTTTDVPTQSSPTTTDVTTLSSPTTTDETTQSTMKTIGGTTTSSVTTSDTDTTSSMITSDMTTASSPSTTTCNCRCVNLTAPTMSELVERVEQLKKQLTVKKETTSSNRRKLISAPDSRMSARSIGVVLGAGVLVFIFGSIVAIDLPRLKQFLTSVCRE